MSDLQAALRAAAVTMLTDYAADASIRLQVYPGRPRSIAPPTAFVDVIRETIAYTGQLRQRTPQADIVVIFGVFDSKEAVDQKDAFTDGFLDWSRDRVHAVGANTISGVVATDDDPNYIADWLPLEEQRSLFAVRITLEGYAEN